MPSGPCWWISGLSGAVRAARFRPCRSARRTVRGSAWIVKLNVDDNPSVVERYRIQAIPTLIVFRGGEEKKRMLGAVSPKEIAHAIDAYGMAN